MITLGWERRSAAHTARCTDVGSRVDGTSGSVVACSIRLLVGIRPVKRINLPVAAIVDEARAVPTRSAHHGTPLTSPDRGQLRPVVGLARLTKGNQEGGGARRVR